MSGLLTDRPDPGFYAAPFRIHSSYNAFEPVTGWGDGAVWQGKGWNGSLQAGFRSVGPFWDLSLQPVLWFSQNQAFPIATDGPIDQKGPWGDAHRGSWDHPFRMGPGSLRRIDGGQSALRLFWGPLYTSVGTANRTWGASPENAMLLSSNGPGIPSWEVGLDPWDTPVGTWEAHLLYGMVRPSGYQVNNGKGGTRFWSGDFFAYSPSFAPGLTLGAGRTVLSYWSEVGFQDFLVPLVFKTNWGVDRFDQRASLMYRYNVPSSGLELYGEWGRNDFTPDLYWLQVNLEHSQGWVLGFRQRWETSGWGAFSLRGELGVLSLGTENIINVGGYSPLGADFYTHWRITEGYTIEGQELGAAAGNGNFQQLGLQWSRGPLSGGYRLLRWVKDYSMLVATLTPLMEARIDVAYDHQVTLGLTSGPWVSSLTLAYTKEFHRMFSGDASSWRVGAETEYRW